MTVYLNTHRAEKYSKAMCYNNNASDIQRGLKSRSYHIQCCANIGLFDLCLPSLELLGDNAIISKLPTSVATGQWPNHALQLVTCTRHNSALTSTVGEIECLM